MKPHEETWVEHPSNSPALQDAWVTNSADGPIILTVHDAAKGRTLLASAAPELARALLAAGEWRDGRHWHLAGCDSERSLVACHDGCEAARTALTKAGVLP